jgi:hypothetical protein
MAKNLNQKRALDSTTIRHQKCRGNYPLSPEQSMLQLMVTILPVSLFWILAAMFLGGWAIDVRGGSGITQVLGLLISFVLFVAVWRGLHSAFLGFGEVLGGIVITSFLAAALLPAVSWVGYKLVGITIQKSHGHAH